MLPVKKFSEHVNCFKLVMQPMEEGIDPVSILTFQYRDIKLDMQPMEEGIVPVSLFEFN